MRRSILVCVALLLLAGCDYDFPKVDSGVVRQMEGGSSEARPLTFLQVSRFADWCAKHREGWRSEFADYAPRAVITFRRDGADVASAVLTDSRIIVSGRSHSLTAEESKELQDIFGIQNG
jgi:hypothetical protein